MMKSANFKIQSISIILFVTVITFISCNHDEYNSNNDDDEAVISLSVKAAASSINQDNLLWEDRVDELRMIACNSDNGEVSFNQKLYFPNGFLEPSKAVRMRTGTYNLYFIANETVYTGDFVSALIAIENESEFTTDPAFTNLAYNADFLPDETSISGRFVMSAIYKDIEIAGGGTENNPAPLIVPTGKVELIRSLAKIEVVFRKKVSGSNVPENTITSVLLENVAATLSVPPYDNYYTGSQVSSSDASLSGLDYSQDSIGSVIFYIPEFLVPTGSTTYTLLEINNQTYPIENDDELTGITSQRRTVPLLSGNSVIRNYHYQINAYIDAEGGIQIITYVEPWYQHTYRYLFQGDQQIVLPPVIPTDSSIIIDTECGKIEILSHNEELTQGLQGAYGDQVIWWDPEIQGPTIQKGDPPYYCEKKYGAGWRLINSCELLSFLAVCDEAYNVYLSNTWLADNHNRPYYSLPFRQKAEALLEVLTGIELSATSELMNENNWGDVIPDEKMDLIDRYFTPGDIMLRLSDFPNGWPYEAPFDGGDAWYYNEVTIQVKAFWYDSGYISLTDRENWDRVLYNEFHRYDYSSTVSRCVRMVE